MSEYFNPVRRGFWPDPSVICVKDDFYMVNSSFQYFPAVPISHSKDMVHWHTIGHAITNTNYLDLSDIADSHGVWAPDIEYIKGKFYITATLRLNGTEPCPTPLRKQFIVSSDTPEGPYSKPFWLAIDNIDPSLFWDKDKSGKVYMAIAPGVRLVELSSDLSCMAGPIKQVWQGTGERCSEGPHIFFENGFYYAVVAEGGTGYGHGINIARSKNLFGPYESCPYNPIMRQKDPNAKLQRAGHGKFVKIKDGSWWCYYLCSRQNSPKCTTVGRETALDPVTWTKDGWPLINSCLGPSEKQTAPNLPCVKYKENDFCDFTCQELDKDFLFLRTQDPAIYSLTQRKGYLRLFADGTGLYDIHLKSIILKRQQELNFSASTSLEFYPTQQGQEAGLVCYYSTNTYIKFCLAFDNGKVLTLACNKGQGEEQIAQIKNIKDTPIILKVVTTGQKRQFFYCQDKNTFVLAGTIEPCTFLSDEGVPNQKKRHTGTLIGLYVAAGQTKTKISADFDYLQQAATGCF